MNVCCSGSQTLASRPRSFRPFHVGVKFRQAEAPFLRLGQTFRLFVGENGLDVLRALYLDLTGQPVPDDPARAFVLGALHALVGNGTATWTALESGDVLLTCSSGIVLNLGKDGVTRIR